MREYVLVGAHIKRVHPFKRIPHFEGPSFNFPRCPPSPSSLIRLRLRVIIAQARALAKNESSQIFVHIIRLNEHTAGTAAEERSHTNMQCALSGGLDIRSVLLRCLCVSAYTARMSQFHLRPAKILGCHTCHSDYKKPAECRRQQGEQRWRWKCARHRVLREQCESWRRRYVQDTRVHALLRLRARFYGRLCR